MKEIFNTAKEKEYNFMYHFMYDWEKERFPDDWFVIFNRVEKAIGFKLYRWQKDFIASNGIINFTGPRMGVTTSVALALLLNDIDSEPLIVHKQMAQRNPLGGELLKYSVILEKAEIQIRKVVFIA